MIRLLTVTLALAAGGCATPAGAPHALPAGQTFVSTAAERLVSGTRITLSFTETEVRAHAGCNHLTGTARLDNGRLIVDNLGGTEMGCEQRLMDQDEWLSRFLTSRPAWRLDADTLVLTSGDTEITLRDKETVTPDKPLRDTRWVLESIIERDMESSVPAGVTAWVTFNRDGLASGNAGCNSFGGRPEGNYRADASTITFSDVVFTLKSCGKPKDTVEATVMRILDGKVRYEIEGDVLTLRHQSGKGLRFRAA